VILGHHTKETIMAMFDPGKYAGHKPGKMALNEEPVSITDSPGTIDSAPISTDPKPTKLRKTANDIKTSAVQMFSPDKAGYIDDLQGTQKMVLTPEEKRHAAMVTKKNAEKRAKLRKMLSGNKE
jgi:hypothetical protein